DDVQLAGGEVRGGHASAVVHRARLRLQDDRENGRRDDGQHDDGHDELDEGHALVTPRHARSWAVPHQVPSSSRETANGDRWAGLGAGDAWSPAPSRVTRSGDYEVHQEQAPSLRPPKDEKLNPTT